jgi:hypothetical protein
MRSKKFFQNKVFLNSIIFFTLFFITDIFYSNFINKSKIKGNCILNEQSFYFLEKNCYFKQKYIKNISQYNVYTNEFGLRYSGQKYDKNKKNIFYLGDSFTYGLGLDYSNTYIGILENKNNLYNHFNFGLQGYSPLVYKYQLNKMINKKIYPKKIILALDYTDLFEDNDKWIAPLNESLPPKLKNFSENKDNNESFKDRNLKVTRILSRSINGFFREIRLATKNFINKNTQKQVGKTEIGRFLYSNKGVFLKEKISTKSLKHRAEDLEKTLKDISNIAKKNNSDFYILIYPWPDTLAYGQGNFNWETFVSNFCIKNCKMLINTFPRFFKYKEKNINWHKDLYIKEDLHFNKFGNSLIAKEIIKVTE